MNNFNYKECIDDHFREESCSPKFLTINDNPTVTDKILFSFKTTRSGFDCNHCCEEDDDDYCKDDCLNPFTFDDITIFYIERNFSNKNTYTDDDSIFHYSDAVVVYKIGSPLWTSNILDCPPDSKIDSGIYSDQKFCEKLSCPDSSNQISYKRSSKDEQDPDNMILKKIDGKTGCFEFVWSPEGVREGDYFICWTYTPYKGSSKISNHRKFYLNSNTAISTSTLIHRTNPNKYTDLLDRYTPEMFKTHIADVDLTPLVIEKLNNCIAKGFNVLEDLTNQLVDLLDSNSVNEYIIYYLSNTLNLSLKSRDPILWRRQIKEAVPLFKKKGTASSLKQAFDHAGMKLIRILNYWQVVSPYYFVDSFLIGSNKIFEFSKKMVGDDVKVSIITAESSTLLSEIDFEIIQDDFVTKIILKNNYDDYSLLKVEYFYSFPKNDFETTIFEYIQSLPLMDLRDPFFEKKPIIPLKNWNVRLIEEKDPFADHIIKTRHPFTDQIVFGKIKTDFPYSENIYNMEEYNGSIRDSKNPCDIDKNFIDKCSSCRSSNFDIDLEIEDLSDDRIVEAKQIISENTPFHAILRTINYFGGNNEYFVTPIESYEILINYKYFENTVSGGLNRWFHRNRIQEDLYKRDELTDKSISFDSDVYFYNEKISLFCADFDFSFVPENSFIEVLSPSIYSGLYSVSNPRNNFIDINDDIFVNNSTFSFDIFTELNLFSVELARDDYIELLDENTSFDFSSLELDDSFKIFIDNNFYDIKEVYSNKIILKNTNNQINKSFKSKYKILDNDQNEIVNSFCSILYFNKTKINKNLNLENKKNYDLKLVLNKNGSNNTYDIIDYDNNNFYITGYFGEDIGGVEVKLVNYLSKNQIGYFSFSGMKCSLQNAASANLTEDFINNYNEYAIKVVSQNFLNNYYFISDVKLVNDEFILDLYGDFENFGLIKNKVQSFCEFYKYRINNMTIKEQNRELDQIDMELNRKNTNIIQKNIEIKCEGKTDSTNENQILGNFLNNNGPSETSIQKENVFVIIQDINGEEKEVNL